MADREAQIPDRSRFVIPTGDEAPAPIQQAPVVQPVQPMQAPIQQQPVQTNTTVNVDQPQPVPAVQQPVQQPAPQQQTMGTQFTGPAPENVPF